jgi:hypothetical protein
MGVDYDFFNRILSVQQIPPKIYGSASDTMTHQKK